MNQYKTDLHIHTVLSPCGDLEMSPVNVVRRACEIGLQIIGITDHNTTKHCKLVRLLAEQKGIFVLMGAEITTKEETHCLAFFETNEKLSEFQDYLDLHITKIRNEPEQFGYQPVVNEKEEITEEIGYLLISALDQSIEEVERKVHDLNGLFIPAHIDRPRYSVFSQLGFVPEGLAVDAFEVTPKFNPERSKKLLKWHADKSFLLNSDAHFIEQIGRSYTVFELEEPSFNEIRMALHELDGRKVQMESGIQTG
jgi:3',5'-nucleoside bisphosphate phosphatase